MDFEGIHYVYTTDLTHSFNADFFSEVGYQQAISPSEKGFLYSKTGSQLLNKQISKTKVKYFSNKWLDTSAVSLINFGEEFTNYQVENSEIQINQAGKNGQLDIQYSQAREIYAEEWAI